MTIAIANLTNDLKKILNIYTPSRHSLYDKGSIWYAFVWSFELAYDTLGLHAIESSR